MTILFCGAKRSGKTSLIDRFVNPAKDDKDVPKPTVALDYKFARYDPASANATSTAKMLAHIYDLGGEECNDSLSGIPVSPAALVTSWSPPHRWAYPGAARCWVRGWARRDGVGQGRAG